MPYFARLFHVMSSIWRYVNLGAVHANVKIGLLTEEAACSCILLPPRRLCFHFVCLFVC